MLFICQTVFTNRKRGCAVLLYKTSQAVKNEVLSFISSQPHFTFLKAIQLREKNNNVEHCGLFHRATERVSQNHSSDSPHSDTRRDFAPFCEY